MSLKRLLKGLLLACPGFQASCRRLTRSHVRVLMYHRFSAEAGSEGRTVSAQRLNEQMRVLRRHHDLWRPDDHLDFLEGRRAPGRCPVVVTVDDGYSDFHSLAFPIFREHGVPVMLFVTTGFVDGTLWFWWDRLAWLIAHAPAARGKTDVGGLQVAWDLTQDGGRAAAWHALADRCRFVPEKEKEASLLALADSLGLELPPRAPPEYEAITWEQLRRMVDEGLLLGAHSLTHPILSRVVAGSLAGEIIGSRERLREMVGIQPSWFCYPQGGPADFTPRVEESVREAGFRGSYVAWQIDTDPPDPYALPRYCVSMDEQDFLWTLCGAEWLNLRLRRWLGLGTGLGDWYWAGAK